MRDEVIELIYFQSFRYVPLCLQFRWYGCFNGDGFRYEMNLNISVFSFDLSLLYPVQFPLLSFPSRPAAFYSPPVIPPLISLSHPPLSFPSHFCHSPSHFHSLIPTLIPPHFTLTSPSNSHSQSNSPSHFTLSSPLTFPRPIFPTHFLL